MLALCIAVPNVHSGELIAVITPSFQRLHILHSSQGMTDTVWTSLTLRNLPFRTV